MKWINHKIVTGLTVMVITGNPVYGIVAAVAATLPDLMETPPWKFNKDYEYKRQHRQWSHWFVPWLVVLLLAGAVMYGRPISWNLHYLTSTLLYNPVKAQLLPNIAVIIALIAAGGLFHIAEDALCGTVPNYKMRGKRWGKRFFRINSAKEHTGVCLYSMAMMILYVMIWR